MGGWDALEGGVRGSVSNRCQGGEWEVINDGVGENHGGDNEYAEIFPLVFHVAWKRPPENVPAENFFVFIFATMIVADSIISNFPFTTLTPISYRTVYLTFQSIPTAHAKLNSNAVSVFTPLGDGLYGHLSLAMTTDRYTDTTATEAFFFRLNPATVLIHSYTATTAQIANTIRLHR